MRSDVYLLETVLRNLISNAIRYSPRGRVLVGCRRRREGLAISVYDTGIGIERGHLEAIFSAYYQVPSGKRGRSAEGRVAGEQPLINLSKSKIDGGELELVTRPVRSVTLRGSGPAA